MKKQIFIMVAALSLALSACNRQTPDQMVAKASEVKIDCDPEILVLSRGKIEATVKVEFPKGYFYPEAVMTVKPVLVYGGGEVEAPLCIYQGEYVKMNNKTVSRDGTSVTERLSFDWKDGMEQARLELRGVLEYNGKQTALPVVRVADGVRTAVLLAELDGFCEYKADNYQKVLHKTVEGKVLYDVNSSRIKKSQLKGQSVGDYQETMEMVKNDPRYTVKGTQIVSYTSPEGGKKLNDKLSGNRSASAKKAWEIIGKGVEADELEVMSIGQDWEGFKEAVKKSDIKDKDLILRVLSMYSDPAVRESEIRNLSQVYTELNADVFPQLRRTRFVTSLDFDNYSEEDLEILAQQRIYMLDEEALLRLASVSDSYGRKEFIYNFAVQKFDSKRAGYNLAVLAYKNGKFAACDYYLDTLDDEEDKDVINLRGLLEMHDRNWYKAEDLFEKAGTPIATSNIGVVNILQGRYEKAVAALPDGDPNKAVACLMAGKTAEAVNAVKSDDARSLYLLAIAAAREGRAADVRKLLSEASAKDASYAALAEKDIEFVKYR